MGEQEELLERMEAEGIIERASPPEVMRKLGEWEMAEFFGLEYQLQVLARAACLALSSRPREQASEGGPVAVLVFGYPGTGKTVLFYLLVEKLARDYQLQVEALRVDCVRLASLYGPEEARRALRHVEHWVSEREGHAILFLDGAEAIALERDMGRASVLRELALWARSLWGRRGLLIVLVTSRPDMVDDAVRSRVDFLVYVTPELGREAVRKNIRSFTTYFWRKELLRWASAAMPERADELEKELMRIIGHEVVEPVVSRDPQVARLMDQLAEELVADAERVCSLRSLYEGVRLAVKLFARARLGRLPSRYPRALLAEAERRLGRRRETPAGDYEEARDALRSLVRDFIVEHLAAYLRALRGPFPLYSDIVRYERQHHELVKAAKRSMRDLTTVAVLLR